jgi:glutamyl-tRNA reductase
LLDRTVHLLYLFLIRSRLFINLPISIELLRQARSLIHCLLPEIENGIENIENIIEKKMNAFMEYYSIIKKQDIISKVEEILEIVDRETGEQIKTKFPMEIIKS